MQIEKLSIAGAFKITPSPIDDNRGQFFRYYCKETFEQNNIKYDFVQFNHSVNNASGTLRGMHYQHPPHAEAKLIRCVRGQILDVFVDMRKGKNFLKWDSQILSEQNNIGLLLPPGVAHGFITLLPDSHILYHHSSYYVPNSEHGVRYNDPMVNIDWPMKPTIISDRDKNHPLLTKEFKGLSL